MTNTEIFFAIVTSVETLVMIILAVVAMNRRTEVSIIPDAVAKAEFHALKEKVDSLTISNTDAWKKMECDRIEATEKIGEVDSKVSGIKATIESVSTTVNLMSMKLDQLRNK